MSDPLRFEYFRRGHEYRALMTVSPRVLHHPVWPGLWESGCSYPSDEELNPWTAFGVNNWYGETAALLRAFAWEISASNRLAIAGWDRDWAAMRIGMDPRDVILARWEYDVEVGGNGDPDFGPADRGWVRARVCVPFGKRWWSWERRHDDRSGIFSPESFDDLTRLYLGVAGDSYAGLTILGLGSESGTERLVKRLNGRKRPANAELLQPGDVFVHLATDDEGPYTSYVLVAAVEPISELVGLVATKLNARYRDYVSMAESINSFEGFREAMLQLLQPSR